MVDSVRMQSDGVKHHANISGSAQAVSDSRLCALVYIRLKLQSDLASDTPASLFAAQQEQGTIFYLPELTALPSLDEYTVGARYLQYHVLIQSPDLDGTQKQSSLFDSLGESESELLGVIKNEHSKDATEIFSQYFLSTAGRGQAAFEVVADGLKGLLQPMLTSPELEVILPDVSTEDTASKPESLPAPDVVPQEQQSEMLPAHDIDIMADFVAPSHTEKQKSGVSLSTEDYFESMSLDVDSGTSMLAGDLIETLVGVERPFSDFEKATFTTSSGFAAQEAKLDKLISRVSELSGMQSQLYDYAVQSEDDLLRSMADEFDRLYCVLRDSALELRMTPLEPLLISMKEWLEDNIQATGKQLLCSVEGQDVQVDTVIAESVCDALAAYFSGCLPLFLSAHPTMQLALSVEYSGADVLLVINYSGNNLDSAEQNVFLPDALLRLQEELLALHGGMSVACGENGKSSLNLSFPVTQAMIEGLVVQCGDEQYIVPMNQVAECVDCSPRMGVEVRERTVLIGGEAVPYVRLRDYVELEGRGDHEQCIVIQSLSGTFGLIVDGIAGELQAAVKPLGVVYQHIEVISGVTVKPDGIPCLVLNLQYMQTVAENLLAHNYASCASKQKV
ncbi:chemotaxis protein CheW [Halodesulfovibrio sp.]|jgi:chemotaxis protein histidine kinase CheA|uniref:chemotaxis protein CheW n=1 Tax=Halodesulfovibrio sp. TaxID=1912772 RepID=UPI0025EE649B|nr:chemotaxis protein CheW [Halodesulfovibrio sp.]MCT4534917.1 chemotaxis protein CheW [Halodesulfovibrio sp.]